MNIYSNCERCENQKNCRFKDYFITYCKDINELEKLISCPILGITIECYNYVSNQKNNKKEN